MSSHFSGRDMSGYVHGPPRQVPGFDGLHQMLSQLLAERVPANGQVLVLGAGGGLELRSLAERHSAWKFDGVDPSREMLDVARVVCETHLDRMSFVQGFASDAPDGPYDGATCLLTMHFMNHQQRSDALRELHARLKPGAPLVVAHMSFAQREPNRSRWIARNLTYAGTAPENLERSSEAIASHLTILDPEDDESLLRSAGFAEIELFYLGLGFRGWVARSS